MDDDAAQLGAVCEHVGFDARAARRERELPGTVRGRPGEEIRAAGVARDQHVGEREVGEHDAVGGPGRRGLRRRIDHYEAGVALDTIEVVAGLAVEVLRRAAACAGTQEIVAVATADDVDPVAAHQHVVTEAAVDDIVARVAEHEVHAGAGVDRVVTASADQGIVADDG